MRLFERADGGVAGKSVASGRGLVIVAAAAMLALAGCAGTSRTDAGKPVTQLSFATPEDAAAALANAAATGDAEYMRAIFGPEFVRFSSGDADQDAYDQQAFAAAIAKRRELRPTAGGGFEVVVGESRSAFPAPLMAVEGRWIFDTITGVERLEDVRVGLNELRTIQSLRALAAAQAEYRSVDRDGDGTQEYATRLMSSSGQRDGLYWPAAGSEANSPLGADFVEGEVPAGAVPRGHQGYFFRILTSQGSAAPGGERGWVDASGNLTGGFAILAYPAIYGETGIVTFQMGPDGVVYQRNLGPEGTAAAAREMRTFDPGQGWTRVVE